MSIHLEDRWYRRTQRGADRVRTARHGQAPRYRAHFIDSTGTRKTKTFRTRRDAERWLVKTEVAHLLKGTA
uniref:Integrase n=1 Tax=Streptomyces sp. NBC_00093 TaxID=2975649 RepID=A0AAU2A4G2_9ACTN